MSDTEFVAPEHIAPPSQPSLEELRDWHDEVTGTVRGEVLDAGHRLAAKLGLVRSTGPDAVTADDVIAFTAAQAPREVQESIRAVHARAAEVSDLRGPLAYATRAWHSSSPELKSKLASALGEEPGEERVLLVALRAMFEAAVKLAQGGALPKDMSPQAEAQLHLAVQIAALKLTGH